MVGTGMHGVHGVRATIRVGEVFVQGQLIAGTTHFNKTFESMTVILVGKTVSITARLSMGNASAEMAQKEGVVKLCRYAIQHVKTTAHV